VNYLSVLSPCNVETHTAPISRLLFP